MKECNTCVIVNNISSFVHCVNFFCTSIFCEFMNILFLKQFFAKISLSAFRRSFRVSTTPGSPGNTGNLEFVVAPEKFITQSCTSLSVCYWFCV